MFTNTKDTRNNGLAMKERYWVKFMKKAQGIRLVACDGSKEESKCTNYLKGLCFSDTKDCFYRGREVFIELEEEWVRKKK